MERRVEGDQVRYYHQGHLVMVRLLRPAGQVRTRTGWETHYREVEPIELLTRSMIRAER